MPLKDLTARRKYHSEYMKEYWKKKPSHRKYISEKRHEYKTRNRNFISRVKQRFGCKHCGIKNPICLEFHHLRDKKENIAVMLTMTYSLGALKKEMRKCIILCANCHRIEEHRKRQDNEETR